MRKILYFQRGDANDAQVKPGKLPLKQAIRRRQI